MSDVRVVTPPVPTARASSTGVKYVRVRALGVGGMGHTHVGLRLVAGGEQGVCLKYLHPQIAFNPKLRELYLREAHIGMTLGHSNIVGVIDVVEEEDLIVFELVQGIDLGRLVNHAPERRLAPEFVIWIALELCKALAHAHTHPYRGEPARIVHRDLKPSNVLVSYNGEIKLTDFGFATRAPARGEEFSKTVRGTLQYMSPEQALGMPVDARSDLFSLGVLIYELLSGRRPFEGATDADILRRLTSGIRPPLRSLAPATTARELLEIVDRLLQTNPDDRFADADECAEALMRLNPKPDTYRAVGAMVQAIHPRETIHQHREAEGPSSSERPMSAPPAVIQSEASRPRIPRTREAQTLSLVGAGVIAVAAFGSIAWPDEQRSTATKLAVNPHHQPAATSQSVATEAPYPDHPEVADQQLPANGHAAVPPSRSAAENAATPTGSDVAPDAMLTARSPAGPAKVRIGSVPIGRVWIDGKYIDWSPVTATLTPGSHVIAVGGEEPETSRVIVLRTGQATKVVLYRPQ